LTIIAIQKDINAGLFCTFGLISCSSLTGHGVWHFKSANTEKFKISFLSPLRILLVLPEQIYVISSCIFLPTAIHDSSECASSNDDASEA